MSKEVRIKMPSATGKTLLANLARKGMSQPSGGAAFREVRRVVRGIHGEKIVMVSQVPVELEPPRTWRSNRKKNQAVRRRRFVRAGEALKVNYGYKRRDGATVVRVMGAHEAYARRCRHYHEQMAGQVGKERK